MFVLHVLFKYKTHKSTNELIIKVEQVLYKNNNVWKEI